MQDTQFDVIHPANVPADAPLRSLSPEAQNILLRPSSSRSQRKLQEDVESLRRQLQAGGMLKPATVINFNPVPLVQDGLIRLTVPQAGYSTVGRVELEHAGQVFVGHAVTIHTPLIYSRVSGHTADEQTLSDVPTMDAAFISPIGIAYSFLEHYSGNAKDSPHMGGVLIFEGDRNVLKPGHLERSEGKIRMPFPVRLPRNQRTYAAEEVDLEKTISEIFDMQAVYADFRVQNAHSLWSTNDPMQQKQITDIDRLWMRYGVDKSWFPTLAPWVHAKVMSGAAMASMVRCPQCSKPRPFDNIFLCPDCRAPYNAYEAFMAGLPVAQQWLDVLPEGQMALVAAEMEARESRFKRARAKAKSDAKKAEKEEGIDE